MTWYGMPRRAVAGMSCYWEAKDPLEGLCRLLICPTMPCISIICPTVGIEYSQALAALVEEEQWYQQCSGVRIVVIASGGQAADFWNVMWEPQSSHHYLCQSSLDVVL